MSPSALIITAPGINCDLELAEAFRMAGAEPERVLLRTLIDEPSLIARFDLIGLPGGFSYGDDVAAGRIMAQLIRRTIYRELVAAIGRGVPMIAPCNGFQIAVQAGLLPGPVEGDAWSSEPARPVVALADNASARFVDRWVRVDFPASRCIWTQGLEPPATGGLLPVAHGEGRFLCDDATLQALTKQGQIAVRYAADDDPNGSRGLVAGICDASGLLFGLMPHPERYLKWTHHPFWTRLGVDERSGEPLGLAIFRNAVRYATERGVSVA